MNYQVTYQGIVDRSHLGKLLALIKHFNPTATKAELVAFMKHENLVLLSNVSEQEANKIHGVILKYGGKAEVSQLNEHVPNNESDAENISPGAHTEPSVNGDKNSDTNTDTNVETLNVSMWTRGFAVIIDQVIVSLTASLIAWGLGNSSESFHLALYALLFLIYQFIWISPLGGGKSIGSRAFKIKVVNELSEVPSYKQAFIRSTTFVALGLITIASIFFNAQRRGFHEKWSKTVVVDASLDVETNVLALKANQIAFDKLKQAQEAGAKKLQDSIQHINTSMPFLEKAGYSINALEMEVGLTPSLVVVVNMNENKELTSAELNEIIKDKPIVKMLVSTIKMSVDLQKKLNVRTMKSIGMEISLGVTPSVKLLFEK